jgi:hypothetical protein
MHARFSPAVHYQHPAKRWLLSLSSLALFCGGTQEKEQAVIINSLLVHVVGLTNWCRSDYSPLERDDIRWKHT